jgi:ketosteroid isomerase-like protein
MLGHVQRFVLLIAPVVLMEPTMSSAAPTFEAAISERIDRIWQSYRRGDIDAHNALLADDYTAIFPDGSLHLRKPTLEEIRASPMATFALSEVRVVQVTADTALASYIADVEGPLEGKTVHIRWRVGEFWVKRRGEWKCRSYQPTPIAPAP